MKRQLRKHQRKAFYYCKTVAHPALFLEMRLGKTLLTIRDIMYFFSHTNINMGPYLISAPYSALSSWHDDLIQEGFKESDINFLTGDKIPRRNKLKKLSIWNLINKEGHLSMPEIAQVKWRAKVCDESTFIKNHDTKVSRFYCDNFRDVDRRYILTGTPMPENPINIFQQLKFLDPSILTCRTWWQFRHLYFTQGMEYNREWHLTERGKGFLYNKLSEKCFFMSRKEASVGTFKVYERRIIAMPDNVKKIYKKIAKEFLIEVRGRVIKVTDFAITKFLWLRQLCSGFITDEHNSLLRQINILKAKEVLDLLQGELKNNQVIIWAVFTHEIEFLSSYLHSNYIKCNVIAGSIRQDQREIVRRWFKNGEFQVLICQPECFKFGANLSNADTTIYYSSPLGLVTRLQTEDRMVDISSDSPDLVIDLTTENSIEEDIYDSLIHKENTQQLIIRIVKRLQKGVKQ